MKNRITRRDMLRSTAVAGAGITILGSHVLARGEDSPNEKLNIAHIGVGGQGGHQVNGLASQNIVAMCDVDEARAGKNLAKFEGAKIYKDYRVMFDEVGDQLDAFTVNTPDHAHFHPAIMGLRMGKHLYCEKPLAHSVGECRVLIDEARKQGVATQLGVQRHTIPNMHRVVELIQTGAIGPVTEVYTWQGGSRGMPDMPTEFPKVPSTLDWDLWLGPAKQRPYSPAYCPYNWRFWADFGTGEAGNWGCHQLDIPYWALDLKHPTAVLKVEGPPVDPEGRTSKSLAVTFQFPARGDQPPLTLEWSHTSKGPAALEKYGLPNIGSGTLFVGEKGMLMTTFSNHTLYPEADFKDFEYPTEYIPASPGFHKEFINACKGGEPATCNFEYAGPMAETVILANTAYQLGKPFEWDSENLVAVGVPEAAEKIRPEFFNGYEW